MKFKKFQSNKEINISINKYIIKEAKLKNPSKPEQIVWDFLYRFWKNHIVLNQFLIPGSLMRLDLFNITTGVCVEISPESSHKFNKFFHRSKNGYLKSLKRELDKQNWVEQNGFKYVELANDDIKNLSKELFKEKFGVYL